MDDRNPLAANENLVFIWLCDLFYIITCILCDLILALSIFEGHCVVVVCSLGYMCNIAEIDSWINSYLYFDDSTNTRFSMWQNVYKLNYNFR
jgi:hypothetical protein